jgi:hypothetical protein
MLDIFILFIGVTNQQTCHWGHHDFHHDFGLWHVGYLKIMAKPLRIPMEDILWMVAKSYRNHLSTGETLRVMGFFPSIDSDFLTM